ncbi:FAD-dependent thymidylate synthase [Herminiimonas sp. CN]|uniref:FAD-dependent thymidylate synthase n=1 Tax=Herminiimonas sp. CN TaxID=1349818 RepID=UPI000473920D|nr:FAD-dependent thymidylate synthase [Herminiimonas sp. CN]
MKTTTSAKVVLDSVSPTGARLTTLQLVYPRFIHSEFMTHRVFSRNASSSRAIPVAKMIEQVRNDPAIPIHWGSNQPGMQAGVELVGTKLESAKQLWSEAARQAANIAGPMANLGLHKQVVNRILEPFQWMHTIVTATAWDNFFRLRLHPAADPNIHELARAMKEAMDASVPIERIGHAPYISGEEINALPEEDISLISAARCARVSYLNHDGSAPSIDKDIALAIMLRDCGHASPFEHVAFADAENDIQHANFRGWQSYRCQEGI